MESISKDEPTNKTVQVSKELKGEYVLSSLPSNILSYIMNSKYKETYN